MSAAQGGQRLLQATSGRPAETSGGLGAVALLAAYVLGVDDPEQVVILGAAIGLLPGFVTLFVANGGIRGIVKLMWRGRS